MTRVVPGFAPGNPGVTPASHRVSALTGILLPLSNPCHHLVKPLSALSQTVRSLIQIPLFMRTDPIAILIISSDITIAYMGRIGTCV